MYAIRESHGGRFRAPVKAKRPPVPVSECLIRVLDMQPANSSVHIMEAAEIALHRGWQPARSARAVYCLANRMILELESSWLKGTEPMPVEKVGAGCIKRGADWEQALTRKAA